MAKKAKKQNHLRLYRFFNTRLNNHGEPFALCDEHKHKQPIPDVCVLEKIARDTEIGDCIYCDGTEAV